MDQPIRIEAQLRSSDDDQTLPRQPTERLDEELQAFLVGQPAHREPRIADAPEPVSRRVDGRVDDIGLYAKEALDSARDIATVCDNRLDSGDCRLVFGSPPIDPPSRGPPLDPRERSEERIVESVEHANGRVTIPDGWAEPRRGEHGPVPRENVDVVIGDRGLSKGPRLPVLAHRRGLRDPGDLRSADLVHSCALGQRRIQVRDIQVGIERGREGERDALAATDEAKVVVENRDPHGLAGCGRPP